MSFNVRSRLSMLRGSAKARGLRVDLDVNKYQELINLGCHFCGSSLQDEKGYCLDRVDSSKGYTLMNVVACCKICNIAKGSMQIHKFMDWIKKANAHIVAVEKMLETVPEHTVKEQLKVFEEAVAGKEKLRIYYNPEENKNDT